jgi:hypothetical protein
MKRILLALAPVAVLTGCVIRTVSEPYPPADMPVPVAFYYYGEHFIPEAAGGGWCYVEGAHSHDYGPERADWYVLEGGYWYYRGPFQFTYLAGHPLPGGGWCYINGPHVHDYYPPRGSEWFWRRGVGYVYQGPYRPERPPPPHYWPRPLPPPPRVVIERPAPHEVRTEPPRTPARADEPRRPGPGVQAAPAPKDPRSPRPAAAVRPGEERPRAGVPAKPREPVASKPAPTDDQRPARPGPTTRE